MPRILIAGQDMRLLETRAAVLRRTEAEVLCCSGEAAVGFVAREKPDLLVLCHSLTREQIERVMSSVRTLSPGTKTLLVIPSLEGDFRSRTDQKMDAITLPEPAGLIACAVELLRADPLLSE